MSIIIECRNNGTPTPRGGPRVHASISTRAYTRHPERPEIRDQTDRAPRSANQGRQAARDGSKRGGSGNSLRTASRWSRVHTHKTAYQASRYMLLWPDCQTGTAPPSGDDLRASGSSAQSSMDGPMGYHPVPATCQISEIPPARFTVRRARKHTKPDAHSKGVKILGLGCPIQDFQDFQGSPGHPGHPHVTSPLPLRLLTRARAHSSKQSGSQAVRYCACTYTVQYNTV